LLGNLKKPAWSLGYVSAVDSEWQTIRIADATVTESGSLWVRMKPTVCRGNDHVTFRWLQFSYDYMQ